MSENVGMPCEDFLSAKTSMKKAEEFLFESSVTNIQRSHLMGQKPCCIWLTGLSASGKSTLANTLDKTLHDRGVKTLLLDGDNVRHGLSRDLGMGKLDRSENIRRVGELAKICVDAGLIVICAFISPYRNDRLKLRSLFSSGQFIEVYVNTALEVCESRDPKGLYQKARAGEVSHFTGVSDPYEKPLNAEVTVDTSLLSVESCIQSIIKNIDL